MYLHSRTTPHASVASAQPLRHFFIKPTVFRTNKHRCSQCGSARRKSRRTRAGSSPSKEQEGQDVAVFSHNRHQLQGSNDTWDNENCTLISLQKEEHPVKNTAAGCKDGSSNCRTILVRCGPGLFGASLECRAAAVRAGAVDRCSLSGWLCVSVVPCNGFNAGIP